VAARSMPLALSDELMDGELGAGPVRGVLVKGGVEAATRVGEVALAMESLVGDDMIMLRMVVGCAKEK